MQTFQELVINRTNLENKLDLFKPTKQEVVLRVYDLVTNMRKKYETGRDKEILKNNNENVKEALEKYYAAIQLLLPEYIEKAIESLPKNKKENKEKYPYLNTYIQALKKIHEDQIINIEELTNQFKMYSNSYSLLDEYGHKPAIITPFNFDKKNKNHQKHTYKGFWKVEKNNPITEIIGKSIFDPDIDTYIEHVFKEDNATPISPDGIVEGVATQLIDLNLNNIKNDYPNYPSDLLMLAGGHSRFNSSAGWSFIFKDCPTLAYGESGYLRIFKNGLTLFSTVKSEREAISAFLMKYKLN